MSNFNIDGWVDIPESVDEIEENEPFGSFGSSSNPILGSGKGKRSFLWKSFEKIGLKYPVINQGGVGSCVAASAAGAVNLLKSVEIADGEEEEYRADTSIEPLYHGSRIIIGGGRIRGDGSLCSWVAKFMKDYGTLTMEKHGKIDLTFYSPDRCRKWGRNSGYPKTLISLSKEHPVLSIHRVKSWGECIDALYNRMPIIVGSRYGYSNSTDRDNFSRQNTSWSHAMLIAGFDDSVRRKYGVIVNSWGSRWIRQNGKKGEIPLGSFKSDAENIHKMCANGDAWAISKFSGYPAEPKNVDTHIEW